MVFFLLLKLYVCADATACSLDGPLENYIVNVMLSASHRLIHDILPDQHGRGIDQLLDELATRRKSNGLWLVSIHTHNGTTHQLELPGSLSSRPESIKAARIINSKYGDGPDRHAHIVHICPWDYCRCKPLQGLNIKRRSRPSRARRSIAEQHFSTCSNICCVTRGSCVYLKSAAPPSTSHLVQVSFVLYTVLVGCL